MTIFLNIYLDTDTTTMVQACLLVLWHSIFKIIMIIILNKLPSDDLKIDAGEDQY